MAKGDVIFFFGGVFLLGVLGASFSPAWIWAAVPLCIVSSQKFSLKISASLAGIFVLGALYFYFLPNFKNQTFVIPADTTVRGVVLSEPIQYPKYERVEINLLPPFSGRAIIISSPWSVYKTGDVLAVTKGEVSAPNSMLTMAFPKISLEGNRTRGLALSLQKFKNKIVSVYRRSFSGDSEALLSGIMLGVRNDFSEDMRAAMRGSGTTHLVALSGYNIAILMLAISYVLGRFLSRNLTFWLTTLAIVLFVLMVGAGASVVRAALMGFLALLAGQAGRIYDFRNAAVLAASIMVIYDPRILRFDLGFQLSFAALLGITFISPALQKLLNRSKDNLSEIKEQALTTFSAELAVMPLIVFNFSYFSILGVIANIFILWLVPPLMLLGFIFAILSLIAEPLGFALSWLLQIILSYMLSVIKLFGKFSLPLAFNFWIFGLIYILAIGSIFYFAYAKKRL